MDGWNLGGTFPTDQLARFAALSELDLSDNPAMKADLKLMFDALAGLENLQVRLCTRVNQTEIVVYRGPKAHLNV